MLAPSRGETLPRRKSFRRSSCDHGLASCRSSSSSSVHSLKALLLAADPDTAHNMSDEQAMARMREADREDVLDDVAFQRVAIHQAHCPDEDLPTTRALHRAICLRGKFLTRDAVQTGSSMQHLTMSSGIVAAGYAPPLNLQKFCRHFREVCETMQDGPTRTWTHRRLDVTARVFALHTELNGALEQDHTELDTQDFYNVAKVDTHVHAFSASSATGLLKMIRGKAQAHSDDVVTGDGATLGEVLAQNCMSESIRNVHALNVQSDSASFMRFDVYHSRFDVTQKASELEEIFLHRYNHIGGRYFAELLKKEVFARGTDHNIYTELRLSIYGKSRREWQDLAKWHEDHDMRSSNNRWMIQVPRIYNVLKRSGDVSCFQDFLGNVFLPLVEISLSPSVDPNLARFLEEVSGFDSVDDESRSEGHLRDTPPEEWNTEENPCYAYYCYYMWANINVLNAVRRQRGLNTFAFRPHCGESGPTSHLVAAFLTADSINHGINLMNTPVMQYLYMLCQIGVSVSPLSNNSLFLEYNKNPFPVFFKRGLNVTLSTDDPLQFHISEQPLLEEYSVAKQVWRLSTTDLSEIARNSVLQSGFSRERKEEWLGPAFQQFLSGGNNINKSNISDVRLSFRFQCLKEELDLLAFCAQRQIEVPNKLLCSYKPDVHNHSSDSEELDLEALPPSDARFSPAAPH